MTQLLFKNFQLLEPEVGELQGGHELLVEGDKVKESSGRPIKAPGADVIDCGGRTMMPGLIDSHVHVILSEVNIGYLESIPLTLMTARAARLMLGMINRGFTSVRDTGGADWGIKAAVDAGRHSGPAPVHRRAPRSGRPAGTAIRASAPISACAATAATPCGSACASPTASRKCSNPVREQMRQGADHIKIMMSGGVASPYDPLDSLQFSPPRSPPPCRRRLRSAATCARMPIRRKR
jgi:imidazolonepropionase-like amidohydrolase